MESTEPREPSYYEVALTHRQVLVAFVVLLTCLLAAFLSGVWVGREAAPASLVAAAPAPAAAPAAPPIEQLTFFSGKEPGARGPARAEAPAPKPGAPAVKAAEDPATETMRKTLEAAMEAHREVGPEAATAPVAPPLAAGERVRGPQCVGAFRGPVVRARSRVAPSGGRDTPVGSDWVRHTSACPVSLGGHVHHLVCLRYASLDQIARVAPLAGRGHGVPLRSSAGTLVSCNRSQVDDPPRTTGRGQDARTPLYLPVQQGRATQPSASRTGAALT